MAHWTQTDKLLKYFYLEAHKIAFRAGVVRQAPNGDADYEITEFMKNDVATFIAEVRPLTDFTSPTQAIEAYNRWIYPEESQVVPASLLKTFSATITKSYGDMSVSFGYSAEFKAAKDADVAAAYRFVMTAIHQQFAAFEAGELAHIKAPSRAPVDTGLLDDEFEGGCIEVEVKGGKRYYKLKGGRFAKYGVRIWPETLADAGIDHSQLENGDNPITPRKAKISIGRDGKPEKVIKLL